MRCSTCGENLEPGMTRCPTCGAAASPGSFLRSGVRRCPRCGYQGDGIPYFKRTSHVALLVGVSVFTYGLAGIGYWLWKRNQVVCPSCGLTWHRYPQVLPPPQEGKRLAPMASEGDEPLPRGGMFRRVLGVGLILVATTMIVAGIAETEAALIAVGSAMGAMGSGGFWWGLRALNERRKALMNRMQQKVLRLATHRGGTLTVTEVAADLNLSLPAAEKILASLDDGFRVRCEISKEGVLYYEFPEVIHRKQLEPGNEIT